MRASDLLTLGPSWHSDTCQHLYHLWHFLDVFYNPGARKQVSIVAGEESSSGSSSARRKRETLKRQDTPIHPDIVSINTTPANALIRRPTVLKSLSATGPTGGDTVRRVFNLQHISWRAGELGSAVKPGLLEIFFMWRTAQVAGTTASQSCGENLSENLSDNLLDDDNIDSQGRQHNTENLAVSHRSIPLSGIKYYLKYISSMCIKYLLNHVAIKEFLLSRRSPTSKTRNNLVSAPR